MKENNHNTRGCCGIDVHKNSVTVCVLPPVRLIQRECVAD
jgi:hypothetical protein